MKNNLHIVPYKKSSHSFIQGKNCSKLEKWVQILPTSAMDDFHKMFPYH